MISLIDESLEQAIGKPEAIDSKTIWPKVSQEEAKTEASAFF